jgi:cobalt-zinc-cadmium efflux system protein
MAHDNHHDHSHAHPNHVHDHNDHGPGRVHGHHHNVGGHSHLPPEGFGRTFAFAIALNLAIVVGQGVFGTLSHSVALLADAAHNLMDVVGLAMAWSAAVLTTRPPTSRYTYGFGSSSILAALANAVILLASMAVIGWEAVTHLLDPQPVQTTSVMIVAAVAILGNGLTALLFMRGGHDDLNIRGAFLHMLSDALVSLGVVASALAIRYTGWQWLDPVTSLVIAAVIVHGTWGLLTAAVTMALHGVPSHIDADAVRAHLLTQKGVKEVHDLHIWPMSTTETALTCHLMMPEGHPGDAELAALADSLHARFGIGHSTFQVELGNDAECRLRRKGAV